MENTKKKMETCFSRFSWVYIGERLDASCMLGWVGIWIVLLYLYALYFRGKRIYCSYMFYKSNPLPVKCHHCCFTMLKKRVTLRQTCKKAKKKPMKEECLFTTIISNSFSSRNKAKCTWEHLSFYSLFFWK